MNEEIFKSIRKLNMLTSKERHSWNYNAILNESDRLRKLTDKKTNMYAVIMTVTREDTKEIHTKTVIAVSRNKNSARIAMEQSVERARNSIKDNPELYIVYEGLSYMMAELTTSSQYNISWSIHETEEVL